VKAQSTTASPRHWPQATGSKSPTGSLSRSDMRPGGLQAQEYRLEIVAEAQMQPMKINTAMTPCCHRLHLLGESQIHSTSKMCKWWGKENMMESHNETGNQRSHSFSKTSEKRQEEEEETSRESVSWEEDVRFLLFNESPCASRKLKQ